MMSTMKRNMFVLSFISAVFSILFYTANTVLGIDFCYTLFITSVTVFYHFGIRLIAGYTLNILKHHSFAYNNGIFKEYSFEKGMYNTIKVNRWKDKMPTFNPSAFDIETNSIKDIIHTMCLSELVHLVNIPLSFVPIMACFLVQRLKDDILIFIITGTLAAVFDMMFVIIQRYNRPRIVRLLSRKTNNKI
ncbi:MAG: hypothetical protein IIW54_14205 [Lachnospiraceae bacterium]|nr:hypothetical protein [Lachnospiraceae bacterium]